MGLGEMPQGFSRLCALQGGVQSLRVKILETVLDSESGKFAGLRLEYDGEAAAVKAPTLIASPEYFKTDAGAGNATVVPEAFQNKMKVAGKVIRSICILDHPVPNTPEAKSGALQIILPQKQTGRNNDIYITCFGSSFCVAPKGFFVAIVSTRVETDNAHQEVDMGIKLLGPVMKRFDKISDLMVPASGDDGADTNVFASCSFDSTSHFESVIGDLQTMYAKITGEQLDLAAEPAAAGGNATAT